jgi:SAM-dependent methyltransferase
MSHEAQISFFREIYKANNLAARGSTVLEVGSYDVNWSIRSVFEVSDYLGIDLVEGPGVDVVGDLRNLDFNSKKFDFVLSSEALEHDSNWVETVLAMIKLVVPGGLVGISCASKGRPEHGTLRTRPSDSPGTSSVMDSSYYKNISINEFRRWIRLDEYFSEHLILENKRSFDLYFVGISKGGDIGFRLPEPSNLLILNKEVPTMYFLGHLPLRLVSMLTNETNFQRIAVRYERILRKVRLFIQS